VAKGGNRNPNRYSHDGVTLKRTVDLVMTAWGVDLQPAWLGVFYSRIQLLIVLFLHFSWRRESRGISMTLPGICSPALLPPFSALGSNDWLQRAATVGAPPVRFVVAIQLLIVLFLHFRWRRESRGISMTLPGIFSPALLPPFSALGSNDWLQRAATVGAPPARFVVACDQCVQTTDR